MSGCNPEYMPILVAIIEAMSDPIFRIQDCGSTPGWEPVVILGGPIIKELDFNFGQGMMRFWLERQIQVLVDLSACNLEISVANRTSSWRWG
jgi:hypothetical protein